MLGRIATMHPMLVLRRTWPFGQLIFKIVDFLILTTVFWIFLQKCYENLKLQRIFFSEVTEQSWFTVHCSVFYNWRNLRRPKQHFWVADQASGSNFRADFHLSNAGALAQAEQVATVAKEPLFLYQTVLDYQSCPFHSLDFWININISSHTLTYLLLQFFII